jgi:two-component system, OmpR family, sensor histidine kinase KdpD
MPPFPWDAAGPPLSRNPDGTYTTTLDLMTGLPQEFKVTRGTWGTVEVKADDTDIENRVITPTGLTIAELTARLRGQAQFAYRRERSAETLNVLGTKLSRLDTPASIADVVVATLGEQYGLSNVSVLLMRDGTLGTVAGAVLDAKELAVARWAFDRGRVAGSGTETLPSARGLYQPLVARRGPVGVIGVSFTSATDASDPDVQRQIESVAAVTATAVERTLLADERARAQARVEREFLRNTLLSSVSHDLRTPLTAIAGSASTLASPDIHLADTDRRDLADSIVAEARRLERIVSNLLDMTRLESGGLTLRREPIDIAESIDAAVDAMRDTLGGRVVTRTIARDLAPANADPIAIGQVLVNLLDNAASHTPAGSPIEIVAASRDGVIEVGVVDRGPGIPAGFETRMFEKFQRSPTRHDDRRGLGLGLAICRGLIELHGGTIVGRNNSDGLGASVRFTLPIASTTMGPTNDLRS